MDAVTTRADLSAPVLNAGRVVGFASADDPTRVVPLPQGLQARSPDGQPAARIVLYRGPGGGFSGGILSLGLTPTPTLAIATRAAAVRVMGRPAVDAAPVADP